jgi:hypothetical protein
MTLLSAGLEMLKLESNDLKFIIDIRHDYRKQQK